MDLTRTLTTPVMVLVLALTSGCATVDSTDKGAIGLERKQYFKDGSQEQALRSTTRDYDQLLTAALLSEAINTDPEVLDRVVGITNRLIPHIESFRPEALRWSWEVNVIKSKRINAACMAGGKIFIYTGLLDEWQPSDAELAAVIGHEIGHALRDHTAEKQSTYERNRSVASGLGTVLGVALSVFTGVDVSDTVNSVGKLGVEALVNLPNSRELELESDVIGLELMARAGYDPAAATTLWQKVADLSAAKGESKGSFWSTHPSDARRVQDLRAAEPKVRQLYIESLQQKGQSAP